MTDLEFINEYRKLKTVGDFCKITGIHHSNLINGRSTLSNENKIATLCKLEIIRMYNEIMQNNIIEINNINKDIEEIEKNVEKTDSL